VERTHAWWAREEGDGGCQARARRQALLTRELQGTVELQTEGSLRSRPDISPHPEPDRGAGQCLTYGRALHSGQRRPRRSHEPTHPAWNAWPQGSRRARSMGVIQMVQSSASTASASRPMRSTSHSSGRDHRRAYSAFAVMRRPRASTTLSIGRV